MGVVAGCTTNDSHTVVVRGVTYIVEEEITEDLRTGDTTSKFAVPFLAIEDCGSVDECKKKIPARLDELDRIHSAGRTIPPKTEDAPEEADSRGD